MRCAPITLAVVIAIVLLTGCTTNRPVVEQYGGMRAVMRDGHTEPRVRLSDVVAQPHAFAVGALAGLDGEITIRDGDTWVARYEHESLHVTGPQPNVDDCATLLTVAHVAHWQKTEIETTSGGQELEAMIERMARARGLDVSKPFPFMITGTLNELHLHVINGYCPIAVDPASVDAQPWRGQFDSVRDAVIVGFFAPNAAGVMTHHGTAMHAHAIMRTERGTITGHLEDATVAPGALLYVPAPD